MWLSSIEVRGLAAEAGTEWDRLGTLEPAGPVGDALALLVAALRPSRAVEVAAMLGWGECTLEDREITIGRPSAVRRVLEVGPRPQVTVEVVVQPDPPMFGRLRDAVLRDPQLAGGLGQGSLTIRVGWLFTPDLAVASLDLLGVALGDVPVSLADRPPWVDRVLADIGGRIGFVDWRTPVEAIARSLCDGLLAPDPARREAVSHALEDVAAPPFSVPLQIVRESRAATVRDSDVQLAVGDSLAPLHWSGRAAEDAARLVHAVHVEHPDVLVVREPVSTEVHAWLVAQTEGDDATLEQVLVAP
ncbi:MAG: hypothetical protein R3F61_17705 [Myxococcota bacterium]